MDYPTRAPYKSSHVLAATLLSFWLTTHQMVSQTHDVAFGMVEMFDTPVKLDRFRVVGSEQSGERQLLLWTAGGTYLVRAAIPFPPSGPVFRVLRSAEPFDDILCTDVNADSVDDLLLVQTDKKRIALILDFSSDSLRTSFTVPLPFKPTRVVVGDINNDKRVDLLAFDSRSPGMVPFLGQGKGVFRAGAIVAPDNVVQDLSLAFLNNDFLSDVVYYDWVKSELHLAYGIGRGKFLDLTTLSVEGTVKALSALPLADNRFMDIVLELPDEFQVWEGDATGDFRKFISLPVHHPVSSLNIADIDGDGTKDFAFLDRRGMLNVVLAPLAGEASTTIDFFAGSDARQLVVTDCNGDGKTDALVLQSEQQRLIFYHNGMELYPIADSVRYSTGTEPRGVWVGDLNGDGFDDVVLVNRGSNTLSVFSGDGFGGLRGQVGFSLPEGPRQLSYVFSTDTTVTFIVTHPSAQSLSFLAVRRYDFSTVNAVMPGVGELELLYTNTTNDGLVEFFCYNAAGESRSPSLVFYQQLGEQTFIERTFRLSIPDLLLGAAVGDVDKDGLADIAFAYRNNELNRNELVLSLGDSSLSFRYRHQVLPLPDGALRRSFMWMEDFDRNDTLDMLLLFPQSLKQMFIAKGTAERKFQIASRMPQEIVLIDRSHMQILDLDRDGISDLAVLNSAINELGWYRGMGGSFAEWQSLLHARGMSHFAFGDLNGDNLLDLAVTFHAEGLLKVYDGRMLFRQSGADVGR